MHSAPVHRRKHRPPPLNYRSYESNNSSNNSPNCSSHKSIQFQQCSRTGSSNEIKARSPLPSPSVSPGPRGNLAYLASRRNSNASQQSIASGGSGVGPIFSCDPDQFFPSESSDTPTNGENFQKYRRRRQSNFLELPDMRKSRVISLPEGYNPRSTGAEQIYRLRTFNITSKGVVNTGDSIKPRRSGSNLSMSSSVTTSRHQSTGGSPLEGSASGLGSRSSTAVSDAEDELPPGPKWNNCYRVVLLGGPGVGKSALVQQFMTSEYINTYDFSLDEEFGEKTVSVLLDSQESEINFIDHPLVEMSVENSLSTYDPHAAIVVYSVTDRDSFRVGTDILDYLSKQGVTKEKAVILVGNKSELVRARGVKTQEGKAAARAHGSKFIETSSGIQHNVDELLVGILKQCRLREERSKKKSELSDSRKSSDVYSSRTSLSLQLAREILEKLCKKSSKLKSKSCENLHVL